MIALCYYAIIKTSGLKDNRFTQITCLCNGFNVIVAKLTGNDGQIIPILRKNAGVDISQLKCSGSGGTLNFVPVAILSDPEGVIVAYLRKKSIISIACLLCV